MRFSVVVIRQTQETSQLDRPSSRSFAQKAEIRVIVELFRLGFSAFEQSLITTTN